MQSIQGVPLAGGSAYSSTLPMGLPGNITFVPINSVDLESLGLTGAQTVPIATGVTAEGQLIMSGHTLESQGQDTNSKQPLVTVSDGGASQELYVPTTTSSSNASQLPETIDGTGVLTQATAVSAGVSDPSSENFNSHNHLQHIQVRASSSCKRLHVDARGFRKSPVLGKHLLSLKMLTFKASIVFILRLSLGDGEDETSISHFPHIE